MRDRIRLAAISSIVLIGSTAAWAASPAVQLPAGATVTLDTGVFCPPLPAGWRMAADDRAVSVDAAAAIGARAEVRVAASGAACAAAAAQTWIVTGHLAALEPAGITLWADEGRLELRGKGLAGTTVAWQAGAQSGRDTCQLPETVDKSERCTVAVGRGVPVDVLLRHWPAGTRADAEPHLLDSHGEPISDAELTLHPARIVVNRVLPPMPALDLSDGLGRIALSHPEAVVGVDCGLARCELADGAVLVRGVPAQATAVTVKLRLAPHVVVPHGEAFESTVQATVPLSHCALTLLSGAPMRDVDDVRVVLRMDGRCTKAPKTLHWSADADAADVVRVEREPSGDWLLVLRVGRLDDDIATIQASRPEPDAPVLATLAEKTRPAGQPRAVLELAGLGPIDFVPVNRDAVLRVLPLDDHTRLVPLSVAGAVKVQTDKTGVLVHGEEGAGGSVTLRYAVRSDTVPAVFADTNLAVLADPVQRPLREARVAVPLTGAPDRQAVVEFLCVDGSGQATPIAAGKSPNLPFEHRDSCRLVVHRDRLKAEDGTQDLTVDIDVQALDGTSRSGAHVTEHVVVRTGAGDRVLWVHGVKSPFDRIVVRVSHQMDDLHFAASADAKTGTAAAQWTVILGTGRLRFYATAAFPTGLYRVNNPQGVLSLNFGVLTRLALLDKEGKESLLGLELGAIGVGLVGTANFPNYPPTLAVVAGLGVSIPLGNAGQTTQAALNLHAWVAYELRNDFNYYPTATDATNGTNGQVAPHWTFIFGPSLSIGNIGTIL